MGVAPEVGVDVAAEELGQPRVEVRVQLRGASKDVFLKLRFQQAAAKTKCDDQCIMTSTVG